MTKKGFTLVEVLFVLVIIGILFQSFLSLGSRNDREINATACVNSVYGTFRNFVDESFTGKGTYSGNDLFFPETYTITVSGSNKITFSYDTGGVENIIYFTGDGIDERYRCFSRDYYVYQTGNITTLDMNKGFVKQGNTRSFIINDDPTMFTGYLNYYISDVDHINKKILGRLIIDTRTQKVLLGKCMAMTGDNTIKECQEGKRTN